MLINLCEYIKQFNTHTTEFPKGDREWCKKKFFWRNNGRKFPKFGEKYWIFRSNKISEPQDKHYTRTHYSKTAESQRKVLKSRIIIQRQMYIQKGRTSQVINMAVNI